jgi:hypothetical protein
VCAGAVSVLRGPIIIPSRTYVNLGQQAGAELHVVLEVEGPRHLELAAESGEGGGFVKLLHAADAAELLV